MKHASKLASLSSLCSSELLSNGAAAVPITTDGRKRKPEAETKNFKRLLSTSHRSPRLRQTPHPSDFHRPPTYLLPALISIKASASARFSTRRRDGRAKSRENQARVALNILFHCRKTTQSPPTIVHESYARESAATFIDREKLYHPLKVSSRSFIFLASSGTNRLRNVSHYTETLRSSGFLSIGPHTLPSGFEPRNRIVPICDHSSNSAPKVSINQSGRNVPRTIWMRVLREGGKRQVVFKMNTIAIIASSNDARRPFTRWESTRPLCYI